MAALVWVYRCYFAVVGAIAPGFAARGAARLFLTPRPRSGPSAWGDLAATATAVPLSFAGEPLDAWAWGRGPRVLLSHGWGGRGSHLSRLVPALVDRGFQVVAFDGPAHGRSRARRTDLVEFATLLGQIERQLGGVHAMIGHSFGASAIVYALRLGAAPRAVVLLSPFADSDTNVRRFARSLRLSARLHARTRAALLRYFDEHADGWDLGAVARDRTTPALLIHDRDDAEIPYRESVKLAAAWPGARLSTTVNLGHRRILKDPDVVRDAVTFVADRLAGAAPSS
jgi:pimeloyl-ACP methyl ester carboxylesterase